MKLVLLKPNSIEWNFAWDWLAAHPLNEGYEDPSTVMNNNFGWEYMGSYWNGSDKLISEFRHKSHPKINGVVKLTVEHLTFEVGSFEREIDISL